MSRRSGRASPPPGDGRVWRGPRGIGRVRGARHVGHGGAGSTMNLAGSAVRDGNVIYSRLSPIGERETVGAVLARNAARLADHAMYGVKGPDGHFHRVTWGQCLRDVVTFGRFLSEAGVGPNTRVVSFSPNRGETLVVELATMCLGATYVPIFAGYPAAEARDLIEYADPTVLVVSGRQQVMRACVPQTVRALITLDPLADAERDAALAGTRATHTTFCLLYTSPSPR